MIQFTLKCSDDHLFDSWFQSSSAFETLLVSGKLNCAICGSSDVQKAVMAPRVQASRKRAKTPEIAETNIPNPLSAPQNEAEKALADLKKKVEEGSDYVGMNFVQEARDMHDGLTPERPIYGEAKPEDAAKLIEDGVPVAPLPFVPARKTN